MAHIRARYLQEIVSRGLAHKGMVGVLGHRQVGKTTLISGLAPNYTTLDRTRELDRANDNPEGFILDLYQNEPGRPIAIDECQLSPRLFPELKDFVRNHPEPGIFLLSGSVRFSSRKAIKESLTGRLLNYELLPFSVSELRGKPLNTLALDLLRKPLRSLGLEKLKVNGLDKNKEARKYLALGGLPGLCFIRNDRDRTDLLESQLNLILDRDLRMVCETTLSLSRLRVLLQILAENQNRPANLAEIARKSRISVPTLRKIIVGLQSIFLIRELRCEGNESRPVYFFEDQGEAHYLSKGRSDSADDLERLAYAHLRIPYFYTPGVGFELFQYRQQGGAYVPFAYRVGKEVLGFVCTLESKPSLSMLKSGRSFQAAYPGAKVIYLHPGKEVEILSATEAFLPIECIL